ncbi:MAG: hypothetical protein KGJ86_00700 [Chloroflexota bacterium]|nr:hypothetical protein [Chloroflexota bacterium]
MTTKLVDYLLARDEWPARSGLVSDYVLGKTGLFLVTQNEHVDVRLRIARCLVRGLADIHGGWRLKTPRLPAYIWEQMMGVVEQAALDGNEVMMAVTVNGAGEFDVVIPLQEAGPAHVKVLEPVPGAILELHSHCRFGAYFSPTDDTDEQGLRLYGVVGRVTGDAPEVVLRLGAWGYYHPIFWDEVFEGSPGRYRDVHRDVQAALVELEEVAVGIHAGNE